jgi:(+)-abscisic acid 8'-hydroxylase
LFWSIIGAACMLGSNNPLVLTRASGSQVSPKPGTFLPFGSGVHACPGNDLAKLEMLVLVHRLVTNYRYVLRVTTRTYSGGDPGRQRPDPAAMCRVLVVPTRARRRSTDDRLLSGGQIPRAPRVTFHAFSSYSSAIVRLFVCLLRFYQSTG